MDSVTNSLDGRPLAQTDRVRQVWLLSAPLGVHSSLSARTRPSTHLTSPSSFQIASRSQSSPKSISQLIMTVLPSPLRAMRSTVSMDTASTLLITVKAGMYLRVPRSTSMNSSIETSSRTMTSQLWMRYDCSTDLRVRSSVFVSLTVHVIVIPPAAFCLKTISGAWPFSLIPTASSSNSSCAFCSSDFVASTVRPQHAICTFTATRTHD